MGLMPDVPASRFQKTSEKFLGWAALVLLEFHMMFCPYRDVLANYSLLTRIERWFGLGLAVLSLLYVLVTAVNYPQSMCRIRTLFRMLRSFEQWYMFYIFFWYIFTVTLRQILIGRNFNGNYFAPNDWWMFITGLMAFVMFPMARVLGGGNMKRVFNPMLKLVLIPHMVFYSWVLWQYLHMNEVVFPSGNILEMADYSMKIGVNRNTVGAYGVSMMVVCLYLIAVEKGGRRIPYVYGVVLYSAVLILSNCRTSWYTALLVIIAGGILFMWNHLRDRQLLIRLGSGVFVAAVGVLIFHWFRSELFVLLDAAIARYGHAAAKAAVPAATSFSAQGISAVPLASSHIPKVIPLASDSDNYLRTYETGLNGREPIFKAALYLMFHSKYCFLFGVTPVDVGDSLLGLCGVWKVMPHAHNFFLQMGVAYGVPCMLITIAFAISLAVRSIRLLFSKKRRLPSGYWMIPVVAFSMLAQDMMEAFLNSGGTLVCVFFYVFAGWIVALDKEQKEKE